MISKEVSKSQEEQRRIAEEMSLMEKQMISIRGNLQVADRQRKVSIQNNAASIDAMIEEMLLEAKRLEMRVDTLRKGYAEEAEKIRRETDKIIK